MTSRVAEFNDLAGLERQLAHGDVAAVLMEPALTNIGIVLPEPGYLEGVRELTRAYGVLLINDETHTFSPGRAALPPPGLDPDVLVVGKAIGGGVPCGAYGLSEELAAQAEGRTDLDLVDMGGVGGTLAGNPVSVAAMRATLEQVLTDEAFAGMIDVATAFSDGVRELIAAHDLPWSVSQLGARAEYHFASPHRATAPSRCWPRTRSGGLPARLPGQPRHPAHAVPQHGADVPVTTKEDVARHHEVLGAALDELLG